jgi:formate hydrogenlyase subunit 3/multisubunit Na+/H+ antiporter MnhD subunit
MFDTFQDLPLHPLVLHATVVLLPLMCLITVLVAVRPVLRVKYAWWVFAVDALLVGLVYVTIQSGEYFEKALKQSANPLVIRHEHLGRQLIWFALAMAVTALVVALLKDRGGAASMGATVITTVAAVLLLIWVVRVGHSGAEAAWSGTPKV